MTNTLQQNARNPRRAQLHFRLTPLVVTDRDKRLYDNRYLAVTADDHRGDDVTVYFGKQFVSVVNAKLSSHAVLFAAEVWQ